MEELLVHFGTMTGVVKARRAVARLVITRKQGDADARIKMKITITITNQKGGKRNGLVRAGGVGYISKPLTGAHRVNGLLAVNRNRKKHYGIRITSPTISERRVGALH
jgi:hypothetical protein